MSNICKYVEKKDLTFFDNDFYCQMNCDEFKFLHFNLALQDPPPDSSNSVYINAKILVYFKKMKYSHSNFKNELY